MKKKTLLKKFKFSNAESILVSLYRAKDKDGDWIYGDFVKDIADDTFKYYIKKANAKLEPEFGEMIDASTPLSEIFSYNIFNEVNVSTIGQFTGFYDSYMTPVFTGDIVRTQVDICDGRVVKYFAVVFGDCAFKLKEIFSTDMPSQALPYQVYDQYKVVGNIYDVTDDELVAFEEEQKKYEA